MRNQRIDWGQILSLCTALFLAMVIAWVVIACVT